MADYQRSWSSGTVADAFRRGVRLVRELQGDAPPIDYAEIDVVMSDGVSAAPVKLDLAELAPADRQKGLDFAIAVHAAAVAKVDPRKIR